MSTFLARDETAPALVSVDDALVADYLAAGYRVATAEEQAAWSQADPYGGTQGPPVAPALPSGDGGQGAGDSAEPGASSDAASGSSGSGAQGRAAAAGQKTAQR